MRKHGLTIDNLEAAQLVTIEGESVRASAAQNPDLFWVLKGGGGNFGIVTRFEYRLHPVAQAGRASSPRRSRRTPPARRT